MSTYSPTEPRTGRPGDLERERGFARDRAFERDRHEHDRPISSLLRELRDEGVALIRQELELARTETSENVSRLIRNAVYMAVGGIIAFAGLLFLLRAATNGVALGLEAAEVSSQTAWWLAPLIVGLVVAIIGYIFVQKGKSTIQNQPLMPRQTVDELKETKEWAREKTR